MNPKPSLPPSVLYIAVIFLLALFVLWILINPKIGNVFSNINESLYSVPTSLPSTEVSGQTPQPQGTATGEVSGQPAILEARRLTLEYPLKLKAGAESDVVRLTLEVDSLGYITPTAMVEGNVVEGEVIEIPNLYATHNVTAEAMFDIAGLEVKPSGATFQPLKPGQKLNFYWSLSAQNVGTYRGTVWLYLNFESRSSGEKSRAAVSAQIVEIEAVDFFGFSTNFVRTSGLVGSVLGIVVGFPFFDVIVKYLWKKAREGRKRPGRAPKKRDKYHPKN